MKKEIGCFLVILCCIGLCQAQQVASSGGYTEESDVSVNWVLGGCLSEISTISQSTFVSLQKEQLMESKISLKVYPMPADDFINIEITPADTGRFILELYNNSGVKVLNKTADLQSAIHLNIQDVPAGFYFLKVVFPQKGQQILVEKIIKQ